MRVLEGNTVMRFDDDAQALFDTYTGTFNAQHRYDINELISGLKEDSLWDKIAILCVAGPDINDAVRNLKGTAADSDSTAVGCFYTADLGFQPRSAIPTARVDLGETESTCSLYAQNNAHYFCYDQSTGNLVTVMEAFAGNSEIVNSSGTRVGSIQFSGTAQPIGTTVAGFMAASIVASNDRQFRVNDTAYNQSLTNSQALGNVANMNCGLSGGVGNNHRYSAWGAGAGLTQAELALYEDRIRTYAQRRGFDVY